MKCPICAAEGKKSRFYSNGGTTTCMGTQSYWDEEGVYHHHDPNYKSMPFSCSEGHEGQISYQSGCSACGDPSRKNVKVFLRNQGVSTRVEFAEDFAREMQYRL